MKAIFQLTNENLKSVALLTYNKKRYHTTIKILLSLFFSSLLVNTFIVTPTLFFLTIALNAMSQTSSIGLIVQALAFFISFYVLLYYFIIDLVIKAIIYRRYAFRSDQLLQTTVILEEETLTYLNYSNRFMIPWSEVTGISEHKDFYLLHISYIKKSLPIIKKPDNLSGNEVEHFNKLIEERTSITYSNSNS